MVGSTPKPARPLPDDHRAGTGPMLSDESHIRSAALTEADSRGWADPMLISSTDVDQITPGARPLIVIAEQRLAADQAKGVAALVGAGCQVLLVSSHEIEDDVAAWLPAGVVLPVPAQEGRGEGPPSNMTGGRSALEATGVAEIDARGWPEPTVVDPAHLSEQPPAGDPLVVAVEAGSLTADVALAVAALVGAGRDVLLVTDAQPAEAVREWIPADALVVADPVQQMSAVAPTPPATPAAAHTGAGGAASSRPLRVVESIGKGRKRERWVRGGVPHREDGPAVSISDPSGKRLSEEWYANGVLHCPDGPARVIFHPNGKAAVREWWLDGQRHREKGPAIITYGPDGTPVAEEWFRYGREEPSQVMATTQDAHPAASPSQSPARPPLPHISHDPYCRFVPDPPTVGRTDWDRTMGTINSLTSRLRLSGRSDAEHWVGMWECGTTGVVAPVRVEPWHSPAGGYVISVSSPIGAADGSAGLLSLNGPAQLAFASLVLACTEQPVPRRKRWELLKSRATGTRRADENLPPGAGNRGPHRRLLHEEHLTAYRSKPAPLLEPIHIEGWQQGIALQYLLPIAEWPLLERWATTSINSVTACHDLLTNPEGDLGRQAQGSDLTLVPAYIAATGLRPYPVLAAAAFQRRETERAYKATRLAADTSDEKPAGKLVENLGPGFPQPNRWPTGR